MKPHLFDVINQDKLQDMQDVFCESLGCAGIITDSEGKYLTKRSRYSTFCEIVQETSKGMKQCTKCTSNICKQFKKDHKPLTYECYLNIKHSAAPLMLNGELIGSFFVGQFAHSNTDINILKQKIASLGIEPDYAAELMTTLPMANDDQFTTCMALNKTFSNLLTELTRKHFYCKNLRTQTTDCNTIPNISSRQGNDKEKRLPIQEVNPPVGRCRRKQVPAKSNRSVPMDFIGNCAEIKDAIGVIRKIADVDIPILIQGETGTGKELIAKLIMKMSNRFDKPFVAINCNTIPENLVESELFGHEKGAFTGSVGQSKGKFRLAHKGTLFLDEIGDVNIEFQKKILRALEEKSIVPIGGEIPIDVDFRLITASNVCFKKQVENGNFRRDLFHRICGLPIYLPPLRKRKNDIILLAQYFLDKFNAKLNKHIVFSETTKTFLKTQKWEGNIRELKNVIYRSVILNDKGLLNPEDILMDSDLIHSEKAPKLTELLETYACKKIDIGVDFEKEIEIFQVILIKEALNRSQNVITSASELLNIPRTTLSGKLKKFIYPEGRY